MFLEERQQAILDHIGQHGRISIGEIQEKCGVSVDSARRDLRQLEERGLLKRTHGGAIPPQQVGALPARVRPALTPENAWPNYRAIAKRAAAMIQSNDCVYLTNGSFGRIIQEFLPTKFGYTLMVNSVELANDLKLYDNLKVYVAGGLMRMHSNASLVDSFATAFVKNLHFDLALLTGAGFDAAFGLTNGTDETATFQRAVIEHSRKKVALLASHKIGFRAFIKVAGAAQFDTLITDWDAVEDELQKIEECGVEIIVAEKL
jgi:DeoR/GlpR family transcriptional regulator of sugar metabolism